MQSVALKDNLEPSPSAHRHEPVRYARLLGLGSSGSSSVSVAVSQSAEGVCKVVVVKTLSRDRSRDEGAAKGLLQEARLTARMNHPNVVQVFAVHEAGASPVIVMEYLAGQSLATLLGCANDLPELSLDLRVAIVSRVLSGLHYAHRLRDFDGTPLCVVHGRVSPDNVVITYDGQVKLIDFGDSKAGALSTAPRISKARIPYLAPEQLRGDPDLRVDVFSIGVILWEMVARRQLWGKIPMSVLLRRLSAGDLPRLRDAVPGVDAELDRICSRALAPHPDGRYRTAGEMRADLERYLTRRGAFVPDSRIGALLRHACREQRKDAQRTIDARLSELGLSLSHPEPAPPPAPSPWRRILDMHSPSTAAYVLSGTILAALLLSGMFKGGDPRTEVPSGQLTSTTHALVERATPTENTMPRGELATDRSEPELRLVKIEVAVKPRDAVLYVDGQQVSSNPLIASMVWDALPHTIRGEADGFAGFSKTFQLDSDVKINAELKPRLSVASGRRAARSVVLAGTREGPTPSSTSDARRQPQTRPRAEPLAESAYPKVKILSDEELGVRSQQ